MKEYILDINGLKRELKFIDINENLAFASFVILGDTELVTEVSKDLAERIGDVDYLMTAEAKGIPLVYEVSKLLGHKYFIVARKSVKSYMENVVGVSVNSITTSTEQKLYLDGHDADMIKGKRICIIDDVISTGESMKALEDLALSAGAIIESRAAILAEGEAAERDDIIFLQKLPLFKKISEGEYIEIK